MNQSSDANSLARLELTPVQAEYLRAQLAAGVLRGVQIEEVKGPDTALESSLGTFVNHAAAHLRQLGRDVKRFADEVRSLWQSSQSSQAAESILGKVDALGLLVVPAGEMSADAAKELVRPLPATALAGTPERLSWGEAACRDYCVTIDVFPAQERHELVTTSNNIQWPDEIQLTSGDDVTWRVRPGPVSLSVHGTPYREDQELFRGTFELLDSDGLAQWEQLCRELDRDASAASLVTRAWAAIEYGLFDNAWELLARATGPDEDPGIRVTASQVRRRLFRAISYKLADLGYAHEAKVAAELANDALIWTVCRMLGNAKRREAGECADCLACGLVTAEHAKQLPPKE